MDLSSIPKLQIERDDYSPTRPPSSDRDQILPKETHYQSVGKASRPGEETGTFAPKENLMRTQEFIRGTLYNGSIIVDEEEPPY